MVNNEWRYRLAYPFNQLKIEYIPDIHSRRKFLLIFNSQFSIEWSEKPKRFLFVIPYLIQNPRFDKRSKPWIPGQARNDGNFSDLSILTSQSFYGERMTT